MMASGCCGTVISSTYLSGGWRDKCSQVHRHSGDEIFSNIEGRLLPFVRAPKLGI